MRIWKWVGAPPTSSIDLKDCTIKFRDGTSPTPNELEIKVDEGNLTFEEKRNVEVKKDRGELDYLKEGDEEPLTVSLDMRFDTLKASSGDPVTPYEFLKKTGGASAYASTSPACQPDTIDIVVYISHLCGTTIEDEIHVFPKFAYTNLPGDYRAGTLSVSGICNAVAPTVTRSTFP